MIRTKIFIFVGLTLLSVASIGASSIQEQRMNGCMWGAHSIYRKFDKLKSITTDSMEDTCKLFIAKAGWSNNSDLNLNFNGGCVVGIGSSLMALKNTTNSLDVSDSEMRGHVSEICVSKKDSNAAPVSADSAAQKVYKNFSSRLVFIESKAGSGTGVFVDSDYLITNRHVVFGVNDSSDVINTPKNFTLSNGRTINSYEMMVCSKRVDLCLIKLPEGSFSVSEIHAAKRNVEAGEDLIIVGHPMGIKAPIISTGVASSELLVIPGRDFQNKSTSYVGFSTNAAISPGSSGSPVFSSNGELLGLTVSYMKDSQNINMVISAKEINDFVKKNIEGDLSDSLSLKPGEEDMLFKYAITKQSQGMNSPVDARELKCRTQKHTIVIDEIANNKFRYRAWSNAKDILKNKPDLLINNGQIFDEVSNNCKRRTFRFQNGAYVYQASNMACQDIKMPEAAGLSVKKQSKTIGEWFCLYI